MRAMVIAISFCLISAPVLAQHKVPDTPSCAALHAEVDRLAKQIKSTPHPSKELIKQYFDAHHVYTREGFYGMDAGCKKALPAAQSRAFK